MSLPPPLPRRWHKLDLAVAVLLPLLLIGAAWRPVKHIERTDRNLKEISGEMRPLHLSLCWYSADFGGEFPIGVTDDGILVTNRVLAHTITNANQAFRALVVAGINPPDRFFGSEERHPTLKALSAQDRLRPSAGENRFSYFAGNYRDSESSTPLFSGFTLSPWRCIVGQGWELDATNLPPWKPESVHVWFVGNGLTSERPDTNGRIFLADTNAGITTFALYPELPPGGVMTMAPPMLTSQGKFLLWAWGWIVLPVTLAVLWLIRWCRQRLRRPA